MITIFKNAQDPEREKLSFFFHATTPFSQVWQILFCFDPAFCDILTKPESMEQAKRNTKKLINDGKTSWLAKKFLDPVFCFSFALNSSLFELCCFSVMMNAMSLCDNPELP